MAQILYTVALDKAGHLIKANDAEKGNDFFCPVCKSKIILRKSGNTAKGSKRPHFAHQELTPNCTPETALHYSFKTLLADKLRQHIATQTALPISWLCKYCYDPHIGNLLKKIKSVKLEYNLTVCQPDIALLDSNDKVFAVVEVVVTHKPEENVIKYYTENNIILIQINLKSDKDIDDLENKISNPDFVGTCFNPKCNKCGNYQQVTRMVIVDGYCYKCESEMRVACIIEDMEHGGTTVGPEEFSPQEVDFAKNKGALIKYHFSKTEQRKYLANTCPKCGTFAGNFYLFNQYVQPADCGELDSVKYDIGYHCDYCIEEARKKEMEDDEDNGFDMTQIE